MGLSFCLCHLSYLAAFPVLFPTVSCLYLSSLQFLPFCICIFVRSLVKYCPTVGLSLVCPPILESNGKNVVASCLPFISLKDFYNSPKGFLIYEFVLPCSAFVVIVLGLSLL